MQNAGLAKSTGEGGLKEAFSRCGEVSRGTTWSKTFFWLGQIVQILICVPLKTNRQLIAVKLALDKKTKQSLGFAYVWFLRGESALAAVEVMNGQVKTSSASR